MESQILSKARDQLSTSYPSEKNKRILKHFKSQLKSTLKTEGQSQTNKFISSGNQPSAYPKTDYNSVQRLQEAMREQTIDLEIKIQQIKIIEEDNKRLRDELLSLKKNHFQQYQKIQKNNNELLRSYETRFQMQLKSQEVQYQQDISKHKAQIKDLQSLLQKKTEKSKDVSQKRKSYGNNIIDTLLEEKFGLSKKYNELLVDMEKIQKQNQTLEEKFKTNQQNYKSLQIDHKRLQMSVPKLNKKERKSLKTNPFSNSFLNKSGKIDQMVLDDLMENCLEKNIDNNEITKLKKIKGGSKEYQKKIQEITKRHQKNLKQKNRNYSDLIFRQLSKQHLDRKKVLRPRSRKSHKVRNQSFAVDRKKMGIKEKSSKKRSKSRLKHLRGKSVNTSQKQPFKYLKKKSSQRKFKSLQQNLSRQSVKIKRKSVKDVQQNKSMILKDQKKKKPKKQVKKVKKWQSSRLKCFEPHF